LNEEIVTKEEIKFLREFLHDVKKAIREAERRMEKRRKSAAS